MRFIKNIGNIVVVILIGLCFHNLRGQTTIYKVISAKNNLSVPYTTIIVKNKGLGMYADENGLFRYDFQKNDTLILSSVGYKSKIITSIEMGGQKEIYLDESEITLSEVIVKPTKLSKIGIVNRERGVKIGSLLKFEYAVRQTLPEEVNSVLVEAIFISIAKLGSCPIKLHIYSNDKGKPGIEMLSKNILINNYSIKNKTIKIDLKELGLNLVVNDDFYIGIEWIDSNKICSFDKSYFYATTTIKTPHLFTRTIVDPKYEWHLIDEKAIESKSVSKNNTPLNLEIYSTISYE